MEEIAKLYLRVGNALYRLKVFINAIGIEQQPNGPNCILPKNYSPLTMQLYDLQTTVWNLEAIVALVEAYPYEEYYHEAETGNS